MNELKDFFTVFTMAFIFYFCVYSPMLLCSQILLMSLICSVIAFFITKSVRLFDDWRLSNMS